MKKHVADLESWEREWLEGASGAVEAARLASARCPSFRLLSAVAVEALPPDEQRAVEAHLAVCESCRTFQADLAAVAPDDLAPAEVVSGLAAVKRKLERETSPGRRLWWQTVLAMGALAVIAAAAIWRAAPSAPALPVRPIAPAPAAAAQPSPATSAPAQATTPPVPSAPALEKPDVKFTMAALSWRSPGGSSNEFLSAMAPGVAAYRAGRFDDAERDLAALEARFPSSVEVPFYLGVSRLFLGKNREAAAALESAARLADNSFAADVSWYLAIAWERTGRTTEAREKFETLCKSAGPYAARACDASRR